MNKITGFLERTWLYWLLAAFAVFVAGCGGCSETQLQDASKAISDSAAQHGPQVLEKASEGDWIGVAVATVSVVASAVGGYFIYRKKRKNAKSN